MAFLISYLASKTYVSLRRRMQWDRPRAGSAEHGRQGGQAMVEYAIILILVSVVCVVILITEGSQLRSIFST
ncbi:MAG: hypothetical protein M3Z98_09145, partial [Candidatus Dormibacteraeota bacterium]|nr:hypothetical protein [Candidatus Dormibacteraeota bacterium]